MKYFVIKGVLYCLNDKQAKTLEKKFFDDYTSEERLAWIIENGKDLGGCETHNY
jgi:hypothetical protein